MAYTLAVSVLEHFLERYYGLLGSRPINESWKVIASERRSFRVQKAVVERQPHLMADILLTDTTTVRSKQQSC